MINLVRGGVILSLIGAFVVIMYAQTRTENDLSIAKNSHSEGKETNKETNTPAAVKEAVEQAEDQTNNNSAISSFNTETSRSDQSKADNDDKKLVTKTASSRAVGKRSLGTFLATAYCLKGRTATGQSVRRGIIAADPRVLKLRSTVTLNAGNYSGDYVVSDTGGKIKGNRIDIWMASCSEARRFGKRRVTISQ